MAPAEAVRRRRSIAFVCAAVIVAMAAAAYAAVPLYRRFCQLTGFNGVARRVERGPSVPALDRIVTVRFDANVRGLPWSFAPEQPTKTVRIGASSIAYFRVTNHGATPLTGRAAYNVAPEAAGPYFLKTQCFCFSDQTLAAGQSVDFPVVFYVDPKFAGDPDTRRFQEIVLAYTFFPAPPPKTR